MDPRHPAQSDFSYANDIKAAVLMKTPKRTQVLILCCAGAIALSIIWASLAIVDEVARGQARVVPSRSLQVVQTLEGGIVEAILVQEGAIVKQGDVLMRIDDTNFSAQFGELRERQAGLAARVARLKAESTGAASIDFGGAGENKSIATEVSLFEARQKKLRQDLDVLVSQEEQKLHEAAENRAQLQRLTDTIDLLRRETEITRRLHQTRLVPEIELLRAERQLADSVGQREVLKATLGRIDSAIGEARARRETAVSSFRAASEDDLAKSLTDLAVVEENIRSAKDRVRRTDLRSPVNGIVNKISFNTIGAVIQPAQPIIEIVPLDDSLLLETKVRPSDIAFIRPQQPAVVKITAYDSNVYGALPGIVERISADTSTEQNGETFYRVMVRTQKSHLGDGPSSLPIIPGMIGHVDILTGRKSVMSYLLKPIVKLRDEALREK